MQASCKTHISRKGADVANRFTEKGQATVSLPVTLSNERNMSDKQFQVEGQNGYRLIEIDFSVLILFIMCDLIFKVIKGFILTNNICIVMSTSDLCK